MQSPFADANPGPSQPGLAGFGRTLCFILSHERFFKPDPDFVQGVAPFNGLILLLLSFLVCAAS